MRVRSAVLLTASLLVLAACDTVHHARIDVGPFAAAQVRIAPLMPAEREHAIAVFRATANELGLRCAPAKYPIITDSYDSSQYQLFSCQAEGDFTHIQLADSPTHLSVEIYRISGTGEPSFFRKCRTRFTEALGAALPGNRITVRYPYHWGREVRGEQ